MEENKTMNEEVLGKTDFLDNVKSEEVKDSSLDNSSKEEVKTDSNREVKPDLDKKTSKKKLFKKVIHNEEDLKRIKELEEALLLARADNINYRKRKDEEVSKKLEFANEDIIKDILPIVDNFERAIDLDDTNLDDELSKFLSGFKMIYCHLVDVLEKFDVKAVDKVGEEFDSNVHQGVLTEKVEGMDSGMVAEILQKGYILKGKVIRPAMVKVSE